MLHLSTVEEIRRLLEEGHLSQRKIALRLGVSRGIVGSIASGRRGLFGKSADDDCPHHTAENRPPERCPGCGAMVYKPCILCGARAYHARQQLLRQNNLRPLCHRQVA